MPTKKKQEQKRSAINPNASPTQEATRADHYVYNDSTGFLITSTAAKGLEVQPGEPEWNARYLEGAFIPIELRQDDSFVVRVVVNDELTEAEVDEWVGKARFRIDVPNGELVIVGGREYITEISEWTEKHLCNYVRMVNIPPGEYQLDLYSYVTSPNGLALMYQAEGIEDLYDIEMDTESASHLEPLGTYFRRTRNLGTEDFPEWLYRWCAGEPEKDPTHGDDWVGVTVAFRETYCIDFLLHLTPLKEDLKQSVPTEREFVNWAAMESRKPTNCPLGLSTVDLKGMPERLPAEQTYNYVDVAASFPENASLADFLGLEEMELSSIYAPYFVARAINENAYPQLKFHGGDCEVLCEKLASLPKTIKLELSDGKDELNVLFAENHSRWGYVTEVRKFAQAFADVSIPVQIHWKFFAVERLNEASGADESNAEELFCFAGILQGKKLVLQKVYPKVGGDLLGEAMKLALEVGDDECAELGFANLEAARKALTYWMVQWKPIFMKNLPSMVGAQIKFPEADLSEKFLLLEEYVKFAYSESIKTSSHDEETIAAVRKFEAQQEASRTTVWSSGERNYTIGTIASFDEDEQDEAIEDFEEIMELEAKHIGDLACSVLDSFVFRFFQMPGASTLLLWYKAAYDDPKIELQSSFADGTSLSTSNNRANQKNS